MPIWILNHWIIGKIYCNLDINYIKDGNYVLVNKPFSPPQTHKKTPWFCDRITSLAEKKRKAFVHFKSSRTLNSYNTYKEIRNDVNAKIRQIKRNFWEGYTKSMERDFYGQQNRIWRMIQNQKGEIQEYVNINNNNSRMLTPAICRTLS